MYDSKLYYCCSWRKLGALSRYLFGFIPVKAVGNFPLSTLIINLAGSFLIGFIVSISGKILGPKTILFFKQDFAVYSQLFLLFLLKI